MHTIKIQNYEREHGRGTFLPFRHLSESEARAIKGAWQKRLNVRPGLSTQEFVQTIDDMSSPVVGVNADEDAFDLRALFQRLDFDLPEKIYLNWHQYDDIDEMAADDVLNNFDDIWYPAADDLDLLDPDLRWILSVHHSGAVKGLNLRRR